MDHLENPVVPFLVPIEGHFHTGRVIIIHGRVPHDSYRFVVNLQSSPSLDDSEQSDIGYHASIRFDEECIVENTFSNGNWLDEKRQEEFPLTRGGLFRITLKIEEYFYTLFVNGKRHSDYLTVLPKEENKHLKVDGDVEVFSVRFQCDIITPDSDENKATSETVSIVNNPIVPVCVPLPGGMYEDSCITIHGFVPRNSERFSINLQSSHDDTADIAMHASVRFDEEKVVRNSLIDGSWGDEERDAWFPFNQGETFKVAIFIRNGYYEMLVDGNDFVAYGHRLPLEAGRYLKVEGDVLICNIKFEPRLLSRHEEMVQYVGPLGPHKLVYVRGTVESEPQRFSLNLQSGSGNYADIAFHMDVRLDHGSDRNVIVCNNRKNDEWDQEERHDVMPFSPADMFELIILVRGEYYEVNIDDEYVIRFNHREWSLANVDTLTISGDVTIHECSV